MTYTDTRFASPLSIVSSFTAGLRALVLLVAVGLFGLAMTPQSVLGQATCYAVAEGDFAAWTDDAGVWADSPDGDAGTCSGSNGQGYPNENDDAVITENVRLSLNVDLTSSGEGPLASLTIETGDTSDAGGTVLTFRNHDLEITGSLLVQAAGANNTGCAIG